MKTRMRRRTKRRGATSVEFALCLPILLAFVFGTIEFSRASQLTQSVRLAAFEGARAGINLDATTADVTTAVNRVMSAVNISTFTTTVNPSALTYTSSSVSVTVTLNSSQNAWFRWFISSTHTTSATVTLLREVDAVSVP